MHEGSNHPWSNLKDLETRGLKLKVLERTMGVKKNILERKNLALGPATLKIPNTTPDTVTILINLPNRELV